ncbi:hypothetical protein BP5796_03322 [Coleophoma crateriformis]|uniref:MARVEL domain-containing protein n=1 Tax=Coleophoma crateriformis TaxID=565419 RepID=A0A3D8SPA3_9HELO|nr:hypothetical protein BP5796_03322 [Coleophoma crateriformis]
MHIPYLSRRWKWPKVLVLLFVLELGGTVAALALFGIASPDLFRTKLWEVGYEHGFNSSPLQVLYAYANYRPIPKIPFVWSKTLTDFNVAISVLSMFILLVKAVMFILHIWYPLLGTIANAALVVMWIVSIYGQAGPDHSDPAFPSSVAWYVRKSCVYAKPSGNEHYCLMAKGTFATTVIMMVIFFLNMVLGIWSLIPSRGERATARLQVDDMQKGSPTSAHSSQEWEMKGLRAAPKTPYTPRTLAFNTLDRRLPLRQCD